MNGRTFHLLLGLVGLQRLLDISQIIFWRISLLEHELTNSKKKGKERKGKKKRKKNEKRRKTEKNRKKQRQLISYDPRMLQHGIDARSLLRIRVHHALDQVLRIVRDLSVSKKPS